MVSRPSSCCRGLWGMAAPLMCAGQPPRSGARSCARAIIAMICHGGRGRAESADHGRRGRCESGHGISQRGAGRDDHRKHRVQHVGLNGALDTQPLGACLYPPDPVADRVRGYAQVGADGSVTLATGAWPAAPVRRGRSCRRDVGAPTRAAARGSPCSWCSGPVAVVATRVHHQRSAANGFGRSPSVAAARGSGDT